MFSIKEAFKFGWDKTVSSIWKMAGLVLIAMIPSLLISILEAANKDSHSAIFTVFYVLASLALRVISVIITIGLTKIFLRIYDGENFKTEEVFQAHEVFWKYIGISLLYGLIVLGGIILLVVPGIYWAIKYSMAPMLVIDKKMGPLQALKESARLTDGSKWKLLGFDIISMLVVIAGYIAIFIGAFVSIPVAALACVYVYRNLGKAKESIIPSPEPTLPQTS